MKEVYVFAPLLPCVINNSSKSNRVSTPIGAADLIPRLVTSRVFVALTLFSHHGPLTSMASEWAIDSTQLKGRLVGLNFIDVIFLQF